MFAFLVVPAVAVSVIMAPCPSYQMERSCYEPVTNTVYMARWDRYTFLHEMGHAYDFRALTSQDRAFLGQYLSTDGVWQDGYSFPRNEEFAFLYADCEMRNPNMNHNQRQVCQWLRARSTAAKLRLAIQPAGPSMRARRWTVRPRSSE